MRQRIGLAAPRRSAALHFLVGAAAAFIALRSGWHGGVVAGGNTSSIKKISHAIASKPTLHFFMLPVCLPMAAE
jgi:hypothetical protein